MSQYIKPFLTFKGNAEEAMNYYIGIFEQSEIKHIVRYKDGENGTVGSVMQATFIINGMEFKCIDSPVPQDFSFNPSISLYIDCATEAEINRLYKELNDGGKALMEIGDYGFSKRFAWVEDKYGISWQLNYM